MKSFMNVGQIYCTNTVALVFLYRFVAWNLEKSYDAGEKVVGFVPKPEAVKNELDTFHLWV